MLNTFVSFLIIVGVVVGGLSVGLLEQIEIYRGECKGKGLRIPGRMELFKSTLCKSWRRMLLAFLFCLLLFSAPIFWGKP
jgi:hypothetical protein